MPRARAPQQEKPPQLEAQAAQQRVTTAHPQQEKAQCSNEDPTQPKINKLINLKKPITWRINNMLLKNQWVNNEIKEEIKKYLEANDNENITIQKSMECSQSSP